MKIFRFNSKIVNACLLVFVLSITSSCSDYLDKTPDDSTSKTLEDIFSNETYTERFLLEAYNFLPPENNYNDNWGRSPWSGASDEMNITWTYPMAKKMNAGSWNPTMLTDNCDIWTDLWKGVRQCNMFLENISMTPMSESTKNIWIGEAHFLRGVYHFFLLRSHGPIPIMDKTVKMDDNFYYPRNTFNDCVNFIVNEFQQCIDSNVPIAYTNSNGGIADAKYGRITKAAALAMKSRVLLYAASPLFNGNTDYADFANADGTLLFGTKDDNKWQLAANAAKECIDAVEASGFYGLYEATPSDSYNNYAEIFLPGKKWNKEVLFGRNKGSGYNNNYQIEKCYGSNGTGGWSGLCPTQELVDAYEMSNGTTPITGYNPDGSPKINSSSGYTETGTATIAGKYYPAGVHNMYANREARFYVSINFTGQIWRKHTYEFFYGGKDGLQNNAVDYSSTGYIMRKTSDENVDYVKNTGGMVEAAIYSRVGEIYLNYAEALNEAKGPVSDVYVYINAIRNRVGLPDLPDNLTKDEMRERIRHERRIELAFEAGHRYFDCHRWKIAETTDNGTIHGLNINTGASGFYTRIKASNRVFEKKHYLFPIPQVEINKQIGLVQSPYWD